MLSHSFMLLSECDWKYSVTLYGMYEIFFSGWKKKKNKISAENVLTFISLCHENVRG